MSASNAYGRPALPGLGDMCFSATASLAAGTFLTGVGLVTLRMARQRSELPYAAIPLLFAVQQITEGVVRLRASWCACP